MLCIKKLHLFYSVGLLKTFLWKAQVACRAVVHHGWTIRKASEEFDYQRSLIGRIQFGAAFYLSDQEENDDFLSDVPGLGSLEHENKSLHL